MHCVRGFERNPVWHIILDGIFSFHVLIDKKSFLYSNYIHVCMQERYNYYCTFYCLHMLCLSMCVFENCVEHGTD